MPGQNTGCVLFADVSGSTKLYDTVGDTAALAAIDLCLRLFAALAEQHGGRVVKTIGDEVMASFHDPLDALRAALDMHARIAGFNNDAGDDLISLRWEHARGRASP